MTDRCQILPFGEVHSFLSSTIPVFHIGGRKLAEYSDNKTYFYAHDYMGGPAVITDHTGAVVAKYRYYPFGEEWIATGKSDRHRFTGAEQDGESGLTYHGARHYSPGYGRWTSVDPVLGDTSNPQRLNRYGYVLNDPVNYVDPDGMNEEPYDWGAWFTVVNNTIRQVIFLGGAGSSSPPSHFIWREAMRMNSYRAVGNAGGNGLEIPNTEVKENGQIDELITNKSVLAGFYCLWKRDSYGNDPKKTERAAWLLSGQDSYNILNWPWSAEKGKETWKGPIPDNAIALVHTHPRSMQASPSFQDWETARQIGLPVYVIHLIGIFRIDPTAEDHKQSVQVADRNWYKSLPKEDRKCE